MITVKELLKIDKLEKFQIVAGAAGQNSKVMASGILDFETIAQIHNKDTMFDPYSFIITSFLFAKDDPQLVVEAVRQLINLKVSCLAYKSVFFDELPKEAIDLANKEKFTIMKFSHEDAFMEEVLYEVMCQIKKGRKEEEIEEYFSDLISKKKSEQEVLRATTNIKPSVNGNVLAVCINTPSNDIAAEMCRRYSPTERLEQKCIVGAYKNELLILLSGDYNIEKFKIMLNSICVLSKIDIEKHETGYSKIHSSIRGAQEAIIEARSAKIVAEIENINTCHYEDIGDYALLIAVAETDIGEKYWKDFIEPLLSDEDKKNEILETAIAYIKCKGDLRKVSEMLYCHKNTIRYRITKIEEIFSSKFSSSELYENMAVAIKLYQIKMLLEEKNIKMQENR